MLRGASGGAFGARAGPGRPLVVAAYRDTRQELLRRLHERGYRGGKSAVQALARELRRQSTPPVCRCESVAGECSQHDCGEVRVRWTHGGRKRVQFFASLLKHSRYVAVKLGESQQVEPVVESQRGSAL